MQKKNKFRQRKLRKCEKGIKTKSHNSGTRSYFSKIKGICSTNNLLEKYILHSNIMDNT